jgi:chemotaxis signal transduction protein
MKSVQSLETQVDELRREFDQTFARRPADISSRPIDLIGIRVAGDPYAVLLSEIGGLLRLNHVVSLPGAAPDVIGLTAVRGVLVPVFGLASVLGYDSTREPPRWLLLCGDDEPLALAVAVVDGYLQVSESRLRANGQPEANGQAAPVRPHVSQVVGTDSGNRAVISVPHVVATIRARVGRARPTQEG